MCRKEYIRMKHGKYFFKAFIKHVLTDKHRPTADYA